MRRFSVFFGIVAQLKHHQASEPLPHHFLISSLPSHTARATITAQPPLRLYRAFDFESRSLIGPLLSVWGLLHGSVQVEHL